MNQSAGAGATGNVRGNVAIPLPDLRVPESLRRPDQRLAMNDPWPAAGATTAALLADDVTGIGAVDDLAIPVVLGAAVVYDATQRTFITYVLNNPTTGQLYVGRTSGFGTPTEILNRRFATHDLRALGFSGKRVDVAGQGYGSYGAIRGREQQLIDSYGGIGDPKLANKIGCSSRTADRKQSDFDRLARAG